MPTTFYFPSVAGSPGISPAPDGNWEDISAGVVKQAIKDTVSGSAMASLSFVDANATGRDCLIAQYIYGPLAAQTIQAQTIRLQMRASRVNSGGTLFLTLGIRVMTSIGALRGTLFNVTRDNTALGGPPFGTMTNRSLTGTTGALTCSAGDYLVFEIGVGGVPSSGNHSASIRVGDSAASDLPTNDSSTVDDNPYLIFNTDTIADQSTTGSIASSLQDALSSLTGAQVYAGTLPAILKYALSSLVGTNGVLGTIQPNLQYPISSLTGAVSPNGILGVNLTPATSSLVGGLSQAMVSRMTPPISSLSGQEIFTGILGSSLTDLASFITQGINNTGAIDPTLLKLVSSILGGQVFTGALSPTMQMALLLASGYLNPKGLLVSNVKSPLMSATSVTEVGTLGVLLHILLFSGSARPRPSKSRQISDARSIIKMVTEARHN